MSKMGFGRSLLLATVAGALLFALIASAARAAEGERVLEPRFADRRLQRRSERSVEDPGCPNIHPPEPFSDPRATTTDDYGNIYVSSFGKAVDGSKGRVESSARMEPSFSSSPCPGPPRWRSTAMETSTSRATALTKLFASHLMLRTPLRVAKSPTGTHRR